ncbi:hypothetical protein [Thermasporomyces composti]|jgi:hypothetical protein|uniref:Uncharacterized protein n=1 Tax=Thermasporomyces composti TaxID=696763 RepID=A0A3D9VA49_THECX|nr:hypothetical protein [Thermasporomyces composti]REF38377.1 hypothetical protein DFJ64_3855 [Thermasporomyces composti]
MTPATTNARRTAREWTLFVVMGIGLALTVAVTVYPLANRGLLADHVRAGYPSYHEGEIATAVTWYLAILAVLGGLGVLSWLGTIWATWVRKGWAPWLATVILAVAVCVVLAGLTVKDTSGDVGLAPAVGWLQVLPCLAGLSAVVLLWGGRR